MSKEKIVKEMLTEKFLDMYRTTDIETLLGRVIEEAYNIGWDDGHAYED